MLKISFCMRRLPHLSREEFQTYYRRKHTRVLSAEEGAQLRMRRYVQLHALPAEQNRELDMGRGGEEEFDAVAEIWLDGYAEMKRDWLCDAGRKVLAKLLEDERKFVDWSRSTIFMSEEHVLIDGPTTPPRTRGG